MYGLKQNLMVSEQKPYGLQKSEVGQSGNPGYSHATGPENMRELWENKTLISPRHM